MKGGSNVLLTPAQAAEVLGVSKRTLMDSYRRWGIPIVRVGKHVRFRTRALEQWIDANSERE
ncbi:helix-turn-helix domain-containing protein [Streptomyces sp. NPDC046939]|uniref:helix-turn-helix domain-containing protein n=1 Tax=Streptomyces sp. NPDC046939 TaxID=3155376 RepID=UPI0033E7AF68